MHKVATAAANPTAHAPWDDCALISAAPAFLPARLF